MTNRITDIQFRSKFRNQMNFSDLAGLEKFKEFFIRALCSYEEFFIKLLWSLTYNPTGDKAPEKYSYFYNIFNRFSTKQQAVILSELRYQYKQLHPDFLKVDVEGNIAKSYSELKNIAGEIAAYQVWQKCMQYSRYSADVIAHCYKLLTSQEEKRYSGGLCDLGFNKKSVNYLKPFIKEIAQLFKDITAENNAQEDDIVSSLPFMLGGEDTPVQNGCEVQAVQDDVEVHTPREDDVEVQTHLEADKNQLSAVFALQHKTELDNFFKALDEVESIGLTAELILSKRAEIEQLLRVSTLF